MERREKITVQYSAQSFCRIVPNSLTREERAPAPAVTITLEIGRFAGNLPWTAQVGTHIAFERGIQMLGKWEKFRKGFFLPHHELRTARPLPAVLSLPFFYLNPNAGQYRNNISRYPTIPSKPSRVPERTISPMLMNREE